MGVGAEHEGQPWSSYSYWTTRIACCQAWLTWSSVIPCLRAESRSSRKGYLYAHVAVRATFTLTHVAIRGRAEAGMPLDSNGSAG